MLIEDSEPETWQDLEICTMRILKEAGLGAERGKTLEIARGSVNVDVVASDNTTIPPALTLFECKYWKAPIPQTVVHAFRTVVVDSGANAGFIVSRSGFQAGAETASRFSNVHLVDWAEFQELYAERWVHNYMNVALSSTLAPLLEYVEPINSRIFRRADALPEPKREEFIHLRREHAAGVMALTLMFSDVPLPTMRIEPLHLPLRQATPGDRDAIFPDSILDALSLRSLMRAIIKYSESATERFDAVFGGRA